MLVTKETIKAYLSISSTVHDTLLELLESSAVGFVENYCQNKIEQASIVDYFDGNDSINNGKFFIKNTINIDDFKFYEEINGSFVEVPATDYTYNQKAGILTLKNAVMAGEQNYKAEYKAGFTPYVESPLTQSNITNDLKIVILKMVGKYFNKHKSDGLSSESLDGASINFENDITTDMKTILDTYKLFVI